MFKKFFAALAALLLAGAAFAAVDVNKASQAELESVKGIGPVISTLIVSERKKGDFKNWEDLVVRVKGVGEKSAAKFSQDGLTVNGSAYAGAPAVTKAEKAPVTEKAASAASRAGSAMKAGAEKAASATKGAAVAVKDKAVETKDAAKDKAAENKAERAEKKAQKAEKKAEAASAASAPKKK